MPRAVTGFSTISSSSSSSHYNYDVRMFTAGYLFKYAKSFFGFTILTFYMLKSWLLFCKELIFSLNARLWPFNVDICWTSCSSDLLLILSTSTEDPESVSLTRSDIFSSSWIWSMYWSSGISISYSSSIMKISATYLCELAFTTFKGEVFSIEEMF